MSFKSVLEGIGSRIEGVLGVAVVGDDGIIVDRCATDPDFYSELATVEYVASCRELTRASESLDAGALDMVMSGMTITPERSKRATFIGPYFT